MSTTLITSLALVVAIMFVGCNLDDPTSINRYQIITIQLGRTAIDADNRDTTIVTASLQGDTPDGTVVTFQTDKGHFTGIPGTTSSGTGQSRSMKTAGRSAHVYLISVNEATPAHVSATAGQFVADTVVDFQRVYPKRLILTSNRYQLTADGNATATLTVQLIPPHDDRDTVTTNTRIRFVAFDSSGVELTQLNREELSPKNGIVTTLIAGTQTGKIQFKAWVFDRPGIRDSTWITFKTP